MTDRASSLSRLILTVFRLNGGLLEAGDALVRDIGLTSARWQVLGASAEHGAPQTVSQIARTMGLTRQAVQRVADDLHRAGLIEFFPNPDHARAKLMDMTDKGQDAYAEALRRQRPWVAALAEGLAAADLAAADRALSLIADRLDAETPRKRTSK